MSTLGLDRSGNGNDWIAVNLTVGDQVLDSPTNNFATWNKLDTASDLVTLSEGNLSAVENSTNWAQTFANIKPTTGKWYLECLQPANTFFGIVSQTTWGTNNTGDNKYIGKYNNDFGFRFNDYGSGSGNNEGYSTGSSFTSLGTAQPASGDILQMALDFDNNKIWWGKNNTWYNSGNPATGANGISISATEHYHIGISTQSSTASVVNFGQDSSFAGNKTAQGNQDSGGVGDFFYTPPSGFLALCTKNLPEPTVTPSEHFNTVLYTGNGSAQAISGVGFQPDWVWLKRRSGAQNNNIFDSVRGANKLLASNTGDVEGSVSQFLNSFDSDGFTVGSASNVSANGETNVAFNWKAPTSFSNDASATSVGSIDSTGKINADAGFAIISYTGTGSAATVAHGLSKAPEMVIVKDRDQDMHWFVYHTGLTNADYSVKMDNTQVQANDSTKWNGTDPTSSVFSIGTEVGVSESGNKYIAYCFHSVEGYSKVGDYVGNDNANGTFVYCGFQPAYVHINNPNTDGEGFVYMNNKSDPTNVTGTYLTTYGTTQEQGTAGTTFSRSIDFVSNGFKLRGNSTEINDGEVIIFYAVAETPLKYANAR